MATWSSHHEKRTQRMKPSELRNAFALAKQHAARHGVSSQIVGFVDASDHTARVTSTVPVHKPLFEASPAEVWIDEYTPFHALTLKLSFRNCDTVARRLKIESPQSPFFRVSPWPSAAGTVSTSTASTSSKIAAGMDVAFQLEFAPHEVKDYAVDLVCVTERERFVLPVRVRGKFAALDIPDELAFGRCPVKMATTKVLTVRNVGTRGARFAFTASAHVRISPPSAALDAAGGGADSVQLELAVTPPTRSDRDGELMITDDAGQSAVVRLVCEPVNVDVYLSQPLVEPSATYLSLSSRKSVKICNDSDVALAFSWRACADVAREELERDKLLDELARMESAELEQLALDAENDDDEGGGERHMVVSLRSTQSPFDARRAVEHKYKLLRKAAMEDAMQFADECFALAPLTGRVWPHSEVDVVVSFSPASALLYASCAFLEVAGQEARLPLQLRGQGIGPRAKVVYNELLDFGDVFISDERTRDFTIQNKGEIPATFELLPVTALPPDMVLRVSPPRATLAVNAMHKVEISFCSNALGDVFTPLRFRLLGSEDVLSVRFKASVIPPVFHFDVDAIDFGAVAYSFPQTRTLQLISASKIAMKYSLRIPEEANYRHKEFELEPAHGKLEAFGTQEVRVHFTSLTVKAYDYRLVISVAGVGSDLLSIPVRAHCHVPEIVLAQSELDFGACYLRYPHKQTLVLENRSTHLAARFAIGEQDEHSKAIATYSASEWVGTIAPDTKVAVDIYLACEKLGSIRLPMVITIAGSTELPLAVTLTTTATGPKVELDQQEIHWGNCTCLVDHARVLRLTNTSLIAASFKTFIRNARSKFQVDRKEGVLPPGESLELLLVANLDDTVLFKDQLHILVTEGENLIVPLAIKGVGTTMWSPSELRVVDFSHQLTHVECEWSCTLENKGKRAQVLTWVNRTAVARLKQLEAGNSATASSKRIGPGQKLNSSNASGATKVSSKPAAASGGGNARDSGASNSAGGDAATAAVPVFSVFPAMIELKPRTACVFVFKGLSATAGRITEELVCETRVGKEKQSKVAFVTELCGSFVTPRLAPSAALLAFEYVHRPGVEIARQTKALSLENVCELPLSFTLRTQTPFSLDCWEAVLAPGERVDLSVEFYPGFKDDHLCRIIHGKVTIAYTGHPQRDSVDLVGDISFPNLAFETTRVDFGCTLNETQRALAVAVTNVSKVDTAFRWVFIEDEKDARALATPKKPYVPINQVFDILPIRGCLRPGESEKVEFVFYGHANRKFKSTVACEVDGGPEYELTLLGEASSLVYKLDKQFLDFGQVLFNKTEDREFAVLNVGKVPFSFAVVADRLGRGRVVEVSPSSGRIAPNDKQKVLVRLRPGVPEPFEETLVLEIAHFQPLEFKLFGVGIFASVLMNLPRESHAASTIQGEAPKWRDLKKTARRNLELSTLNAAVVAASSSSGGGSNSSSATGLASSDSRSTISTQARVADRASSIASMPPSPLSKAAQRSNGSHSPVRAHAQYASSSGNGPPIDDLDIEIEACRLFFAEYLLAQEGKRLETKQRAEPLLSADVPQQDSDEQQRAAEALSAAKTLAQRPESSGTTGAGGVGTAKPATKKGRGAESFPFVLSHFVLDFGNVVLGTHKIRKFTITNIGHVPASFQLDKNLALARGFQIEPERVVRLPEKQAVEFTVTFQARKQIALGVHQAQLPVVMKNGPPSVLTIRAHVTVPDLALSLETLDFGKMAVSTCHTLCTQLHNTSAVTAEWAVKKPMGSAKDLDNFRVTPASGVLAPGFKANVQIEFVPDDSRHFALKLPIKVASNPKTRSITCRGEGSELRLSFEPPMLELGPTLPCARAVERVVAMRNDSDYAVEVFSLDFDAAFRDDEELLRHLSVFSTDGIVNLPLRTPGQPLSEYLLENGLISADSLDAPALESTDLTGSESHLPSGSEYSGDSAAGMAESTSAASLTTTKLTNQQELDEALGKEPGKPRKALDYILLGPPRCGKSTQAQLLAEKENVRVWTIDDAVRSVCLEASALGDATRVALGLVPASASETTDAEQTADAAIPSVHSSATELIRDTSESPESDESMQNELAAAALSQSSSSSSSPLASLLGQILLWRVSQPDLQSGGVLDGFDSVFVPFDVAVMACTKALAAARVVVLNFDEDSYDAMAAALRADEVRSLGSTSVTPAASSDRLSYTGSAAEIMQEGDAAASGEQQTLEKPGSSAEEQQPEIAITEPEVVEEGAFAASTLAEFRDHLDRIAASGAQSRPRTFAEYCSGFEASRRCVLGFLMRDHELRDSASGASLAALTPSSADQLLARKDSTEKPLKEWMRPDNFWLEVPISEPGAALFIHNIVYAVVEKCVRELESSHLAVPAPVKYQIIRRPTERFPRKPVTRFRIFECPASADHGAVNSNQQDESEDAASTDPAAAVDSAATSASPPSDANTTSSASSPPSAATRWVIPARSKVDLVVQFASADVGVFDCSLGFEIVGVRREFTLFCRGVCAVPSLNSDPRNVFMSRVKSRPDGAFVTKKFVLAKNQFEFGPLIVLSGSAALPASEQDFALCAKTNPNNIEVFRMSNTSAFPLRVDFCLEKVVDTAADAFAVFPPFLDIAEGETREVKLWASPPSDGLHESNLICCVSDNPEPIAFAVSCFGCTPAIGLHGPWEQPAAGSTSESESESETLVSARDGITPGRSTPVLDFEQLLLKRQDEKTFFIENVSPIAVAWSLLAADLPPDFRLFPTEGTIKPLQKTPILAIFTATTEATYRHEIHIQFSDAESALSVDERTRRLPLVLAAEAYKIDVSSFDRDSASIEGAAADAASANGDGSLDFGLVRVGESHVRSFSIRNRGKYNIKYVMGVRTHAARELFKVTPMELVLEPGAASSVSVTFTSRHEVALRDCKDIKCTIIEMLSGEPCREFIVLTTVRSVFSVFRVQPSRGINFGPHKYNDPARNKRIEIRNDGEFPFKFRVCAASDNDGGASHDSNSSGDALTSETILQSGTLGIGQFTVSPDCGTVDPGVIVGLDVMFQPQDCRVYRELLRVEISGCNPLEAASASDLQQYELVGESCYPGITTNDYESIFEEQIVVRSIGLGASASLSATTMASGSSGDASELGNLLSTQSVVFAEKEKLFSFGAMIAAASSKGAVERFKITNPTKVSTTVHFQITPHAGAGADSVPQAFTVQPAVWEIPPLEHRFVSVYFKPTTIASYHAGFSARVDDSPAYAGGTTSGGVSTPAAATTTAVASSSDTTLLEFELHGEGTMPCISVVEPTLRDTTTAGGGCLLLNFDRVRVSKSKDLAIVLRNDGILSATVLFAMQANTNFVFALGNGSIALAPKAIETLHVQFKPQRVHDEPTVSVLKITVHNNPFDETSIRLVGTGFREDLVFEDLPLGHDDELHFDDIELPALRESRSSDTDTNVASGEDDSLPPVTRTDVKVFSLCNQSSEPIRFAWPATPPFAFSPAVGHLRPRAYKLIRATFAPGSLDAKAAPATATPAAVVYAPHVVALQAQRIAYKDSAAPPTSDWDENSRTVSFDAALGLDETLPEPAFDAVGAPAVVSLKCFAAAGALAFECDTTAIHFKRTFMLQACSHRVAVRNTSKIRLQFAWRFERAVSVDSDGFLLPSATAGGADDDCPFEISPAAGTLAPESAQVFTVKFAPMEVDEYHYTLMLHAESMSGSDGSGARYEDARALRIDVRGASLRPACHFDVERSDYAQRRAAHLLGPNGELGPLDASVKVIEMASLGVRVRNTKRFYVVNPTNVSYEFTWTPAADVNACFRCATPKGLMLAGKRCEMIFEFTPQQLALEEMFWTFAVPHFHVTQLFLFVGTTTEPRVLLDRGSVNFNTLLIGSKALQSVALVNHEHVPFHFVFDRASLDFANDAPSLLVHPLSGVVPPHGRASVDIAFVPNEEKAYNFNLSCLVKRKPSRLALNVKGEGYSIHDALTLAADDRNDARPVLLGAANSLDFGAVRVHEALERVVVIHNTGKFNFEFSWSAGANGASVGASGGGSKLPPALTVEPMYGTVKKTDKVTCRLTFAPTKQTALDGAQLACTIAGARTYVFALQGHAVPPSLQFSFLAHDFGACFIAEPDALPMAETTHLSIFNMDADIGVDLDCMFEKKPHLRVECAPTVLGPRESVTVPIVFTARHEVTYAEVVSFTVNGSSTVSVSIRGEGIVPKVELVNPAMQSVAFSALRIGQQAARSVKIVNRAKRKITVALADDAALTPGVPSLEALGISVASARELTLRPKETADIEFRFAPTTRVPAFQKDVFLDVAGSKKKLVTLSGCCQGMDVALDTDVLAFGTVCLGSQLVRTVRLQNRGDVAAKFQWNPRDFAPDFSIVPVEGTVAPNYHKTLEVTFKPAAANTDVRYDHLACVVDGTAPVYLTLVGGCVKQATSSIQELAFASRVRETSTRAIVIENKTSSPWNLFPVVTGEHWSCQESVAVPAEGRASIDIVYCPLRMTQSGTSSDGGESDRDRVAFSRPERLEGSIFFAIPDGTALLYNVVGTASAPASAGTLSLSTPAKKTLAVAVAVKNWLKTAQTFDVTITQRGAVSESVLAQGPTSITVQGGATRTYSLKVFSYTEGAVELLVQFRNPESGEYLKYDVHVNVTRAAEVETLHFEAPVRQSLKKVVTIENPFEAQRVVHFTDPESWWKCSSTAIRVRQLTAISGRPEGTYEVEYRPTLHADAPVEALLTIAFAELGEYTYRLVLATQQAGVERTLHFKVPLGSSQTQSFAFTTFADKPAELACSVRELAFFSVPSVLKVEPAADWGGRATTVQIKFEPEALGDVRDTLTLFSDSVGEYKCSLQGVSVPPLPQGPFVIATTREIEFRNVFSTPKDFDVLVDNPRFVVSAKTLSIPPKASKVITVKVDHAAATASKPGGPAPGATGKLFISCPAHKELPPWVYYLEAAPPS